MITNNLVRIRLREFKDIVLFALSWSLCFVVPHFQQTFNVLVIITHLLIAILLSFTLYQVLLLDNFRKITLNLFFISLLPIFYIASMILAYSSKDKFYFFINRFGAGSMYKNDKVYLFSDLTHLTSASSCSIPVKIGESICDPFSRIFNQNPHIVDFLKVFGFSNLFFAGFISTLLFFFIMLMIYYKQYLSTVSFLLVLLSPPVILALDRGNEIITLLLILPGLYLIKRNSRHQMFGALLLCLATVFKLWPVILLISIVFFLWNHLAVFSRLLIFVTLFYWIIYRDNAFNMLDSTQKGGPFGLSLGLVHYINGSISWTILPFFLLATSAISTLVFIKFNLISYGRYENSLDLFVFNSLILTYFTIWATGDSYIYRLILLIPVLVFLRRVFVQVPTRTALETLIVATMLTSKLTITTIMTSTLAIVFAIILIHQTLILKQLRFIK